MEPEYITYQKFNDIVLAEEFAEHLVNHHIKYTVEEQMFRFDPSLAMNSAQKEYAIKIKAEDFKRVTQLLKDDESEAVNKIGKDYYLFAFNNDELLDVIVKSDEWSSFDVVLARKILGDRGKTLTEEEILDINFKRREELKTPEPSQHLWIAIGYIVALLGGILGIFIGWYLFTYKKTLPDGERVWGYSDEDRKQGRLIFYLSIIVFVLAIIYKVIYITSNPY